jgi:hypothetical protein
MATNTDTRAPAALIAVIALVAGLVSASPAAGAVRYASPLSLDTTGTCGSASPCRLDHAVGGASAGDEVVVTPGDYVVSSRVRAQADVLVHGQPGEPMPRLIGIAAALYPTLEMQEGGTVRGLYLETSANTALALAKGARADRVVAVAANVAGVTEAIRLESSPAPRTALTNSVARMLGSGSAVYATDGSGPAGGATLVNVTAIATGVESWGVATQLLSESPVLRNVVARGGTKDLHGKSGSLGIDVAYSNFRTSGSANWIDGGNNQKDVAPSFVSELTGDYRQAAGSPTIDAGTSHPLHDGTTDPDGRSRWIGVAPDIGAYEHQPADGGSGGSGGSGDSGGGDGTGGSGGSGGVDVVSPILDTTTNPKTDPVAPPTDPTAGLPAPVPPVLGTSVGVENSGGSPLVQLPGSTEFVPLTTGATIPVGSTIDATRGEVTLTSVRDSSGEVQSGTFWGGAFKVRQSRGRKPVTELVLTGGDFSRCGGSRTAGKGVTAARGRHSARVRRLWGRDRRGRFRTRGRRSHATVRGTVWLVEDRCDATLTRVREGAVVVRDFRKRRNVLVRAGGRYLARAG